MCPGPGPRTSWSTVGSDKTSQPCVGAISEFPSCPGHLQPRPISQQCLGLEHTVRTTGTRQKGREGHWVLVMAPHSHLHSLCMSGISPVCRSHAQGSPHRGPSSFPTPTSITLAWATSPSCCSPQAPLLHPVPSSLPCTLTQNNILSKAQTDHASPLPTPCPWLASPVVSIPP